MSGVDFILHRLIRRERLRRLKTFTMIAIGLPLSLLAPLFLATTFWLVLRSGRDLIPFAARVGWLDLFVILTVVTIPLLYRLILRSGGDYLSDVLRETGPTASPGRGLALMPAVGTGGSAVVVGGLLINPRASSAAIVEFFLIGPKLVVGGWRQARLARSLKSVDRGRAARVVAALLSRDRGVDTQRILEEGEIVGDLVPALAYLTHHQWIGAGERWLHIWLDSEARSRLEALPRDARGEPVTVLDPSLLKFTGRHREIDADTLPTIAKDVAVVFAARRRLLYALGGATFVPLLWLVLDVCTGGARLDGFHCLLALLTLVFGSLFVGEVATHFWRERPSKTLKIMLQHQRCPHCGYDLRMLPRDATDGTTVCPECGHAWMLAPSQGG